MTTANQREQDEALTELREILKPGDTLFTVLRHKSSTGMYRAIDVYKFEAEPNGQIGPRWLSRLIARALDWRFDQRYDALGVPGAGMDMGFHVVNSLSHALYPHGMQCLGDHCPANDHSNGDRDYTPGHQHSGGSGAYAIRQRWL